MGIACGLLPPRVSRPEKTIPEQKQFLLFSRTSGTLGRSNSFHTLCVHIYSDVESYRFRVRRDYRAFTFGNNVAWCDYYSCRHFRVVNYC